MCVGTIIALLLVALYVENQRSVAKFFTVCMSKTVDWHTRYTLWHKSRWSPVWCSSHTSPCALLCWHLTFSLEVIWEWHIDNSTVSSLHIPSSDEWRVCLQPAPLCSFVSSTLLWLPPCLSYYHTPAYHKHNRSIMVGNWQWPQTRILSLQFKWITLIIYTVPTKTQPQKQLQAIMIA